MPSSLGLPLMLCVARGETGLTLDLSQIQGRSWRAVPAAALTRQRLVIFDVGAKSSRLPPHRLGRRIRGGADLPWRGRCCARAANAVGLARSHVGAPVSAGGKET